MTDLDPQALVGYRHRLAQAMVGCVCNQVSAAACGSGAQYDEQGCRCVCHVAAASSPGDQVALERRAADAAEPDDGACPCGRPRPAGRPVCGPCEADDASDGVRLVVGRRERLQAWIASVRAASRCSCAARAVGLPHEQPELAASAYYCSEADWCPGATADDHVDVSPCSCPCHEFVEACLFRSGAVSAPDRCPCGRCAEGAT